MPDDLDKRDPQHAFTLHLTIRGITGSAIALYRLEPGKIAVTAVATFIPIDLLAVALHGWSTYLLEIGHTGLSAGAEFLIFLLVTGGQVFLAGVLDHLAGARLANRPSLALGEAYRRLPLARLIVADILASFAASIASLVFVLPGVIVFALFGITGPVINIEDRGVMDALKRSASLVYPHLWFACVIVALPLTAELAVEDWFLQFAHAAPVLLILVVSAILSVTIRALIALLEVLLGHALIRDSRGRSSGVLARI